MVAIYLPDWYMNSWASIKVRVHLPRELALLAAVVFLPVLLTLFFTRRLYEDKTLNVMLLALRNNKKLEGHTFTWDEFEAQFVRSFQVSTTTMLVSNSLLLIVILLFSNHGAIYFKFWFFVVAPFTVVGLQMVTCNLVLQGVFHSCLYEVECFLKLMESPAPHSKQLGASMMAIASRVEEHEPSLQLGFWIDLIRRHQQMDDKLERLCHACAATLLAFVCTWAVYVFGMFVIFFATEEDIVKVFVVASTGMLFLMIQAKIFRGPAQITEMCWSKGMSDGSIVRVAAMHFGRERMSEDVRVEHANFMEYLNWVDCGFEVPIVGVISMDRLMKYAKLTVSVVPMAIGYVLEA